MKKIAVTLCALVFLLCSCAGNRPTKYESESNPTKIITPPSLPLSVNEPADIPITEKRISFLAAGDNVIHPCIYIDARNRATESTREYNFKPMYQNVADFIASFDIAFINQETLMGGKDIGYSGYPTFNSPQDLGLDLIDIGFDIINIANNHMCDKGIRGLSGTLDFWENQPVTLIGGYRNREDYDTIRYHEVDGVKIALLSYTYGTNGIRLPSSTDLVVPYINDEDIIRQCNEARKNCDLLIASVHWGTENSSTVSDEQKHFAELMAQNGVNVIIGHHPHVLQPIEWISTEAGDTLCIYSLGNMVSAMEYWQNMVGGFFTFDIVALSNGEVRVENVKFLPTAFFYGPSYYNSCLYFLEDYTDELAEIHGTKKLYGHGAYPSDMKKYADNIMGDYIAEKSDYSFFSNDR